MQWLVWTSFVLAVGLRWKTQAAWPGLVFGGIFALLGSYGDALWVWSAENNGSGLPSGVRGDPSGSYAFLWAAIGSLAAALTMPRGLRHRSDDMPKIAMSSWPKYQKFSFAASLTAYVLWLLGQGPSFFYRESYTVTDGIDFFIRLTGFIGPVLGLTALVLGIAGVATGRQRTLQVVLGLLWFMSATAVGTRMAVSFPLVVLLVLAARLRPSSTFSSLITAVFGLYLCCYATLVAFIMSLTVRGQAHGLLQLGNLIHDENIPRLNDPGQWITALQFLVSSITASVPITQLSVVRAPSVGLLILNSNPLPAQMLTLDTFDQERLWPFGWIPLSMVGEWYGATGPFGQAALFFCITLIAGCGIAAGTVSRNPLIVAVVLGLSGIVLAMSVQYPSRSFWRGVSLLVSVTVIAHVLARRAASRQEKVAEVGVFRGGVFGE